MLLVQWNLNGFYTHLNKLQLLIKQTEPEIICLQETNFRDDHNHQLRGFQSYTRNRQDVQRASGGVTTFIKSNIETQKINITTQYEVVAVTVHIAPQKISIVNIYIPNSQLLEAESLQILLDQIPQPYIITGDLNAHNILWGSKHTDNRGKIIERLINTNNLVILNTGANTRYNTQTGDSSAIDLTLCTASLATCITSWQPNEYLYGSDHHPIEITYDTGTTNTIQTTNPKWNINRADWNGFSDYISKKLDHRYLRRNIEDTLNHLESTIIQASEQHRYRKKISKI